MTTNALFRFTGPDKSQLVCVRHGNGWTTQSQSEFFAANGVTSIATMLWDALPYVPKPLDDFPQLEAALTKAREYLVLERPVRERMAHYRAQGTLADEAELLGIAAEAYARIVSMYLAKAVTLFLSRRYSYSLSSVASASQ